MPTSTAQRGPKTRKSNPPATSEEFLDLEHLDRPELDDDDDEWDSKSAILRKTPPPKKGDGEASCA